MLDSLTMPRAAGPIDAQARHFIILGAQKSGTTTLYGLLRLHPQIAMSRQKETDFFRRDAGPDPIADYRALFDRTAPWMGEASPTYTMAHEHAGVPERIRAALPGAKLIYIVRDPVARAVSQYRHDWLSGRVASLSMARGLRESLDRCIATSCYHAQITKHMPCHDPERLLVLDFEALKHDEQAMLDGVCRFLGLPSVPLPEALSVPRNRLQDRQDTPRLLLRHWNSPLVQALRAVVPRGAVRAVKRLYGALPGRAVPPLPPEAMDYIRAGVAGDAARFRAWTGMTFVRWSV